jgi:hypothetical protein
LICAAVLTVMAAGCADGRPPAAAPVGSSTTGPGPLVAPATSPQLDAKYLSDVAAADSALGTYIQTYGDTAVRTLLTDGGAFCAFLAKGGGLDQAMSSVVIGANGVEGQTHLPQNVTTYNAIDGVALVVLCPDEQSRLPAAARGTINQLQRQLSGTAPG